MQVEHEPSPSRVEELSCDLCFLGAGIAGLNAPQAVYLRIAGDGVVDIDGHEDDTRRPTLAA